jgi:hypothetical protein
LTDGTTYTVSVTERNSLGVGPGSAASSPIIPTGPALLVSVSAAKTVVVSGPNPTLTLRTKLRAGTTLAVTLEDGNGHTLVRWGRAVAAGTAHVDLPIPKQARRPGDYTIHVTAGSETKLLPVLLRTE